MVDAIDGATADTDNASILDRDVQAVAVGVQHRGRLRPVIY
jgi:hypothetical protein